MRGRVARRRRESERDLWLAYHTGLFSAVAQGGKLKAYGHYWGKIFGVSGEADAALMAFQKLKARGIPVNIKKLN